MEVSRCHQSFFLFIADLLGHLRRRTFLKLGQFSYTSLHDDKEVLDIFSVVFTFCFLKKNKVGCCLLFKKEQGGVLLASEKMRTCTCLQQVGKLVGARECGVANTALTRISSRRRLAQTLAAQDLCVSALPSFSGRVSEADAPTVRPASLHQRAVQSPRVLRGLHVARARRSSALRELAEQQQERREVAEEAQTETGIAAKLVFCVGVPRQCLDARQFARELAGKERTG